MPRSLGCAYVGRYVSILWYTAEEDVHVDLFLFSFSFLRTDINLFGDVLILILESLSSFIRLYFLIVIYSTYFYCRCQSDHAHSNPRLPISKPKLSTPSPKMFFPCTDTQSSYFLAFSPLIRALFCFEVIEWVNMSTSKESYIYQFETKSLCFSYIVKRSTSCFLQYHIV